MKIFNSAYYPAVWYGQRVAQAAEALEFALYRLRRCRSDGIWKVAHRQTVRSCLRDLRYELLINASGQARQTLEFMQSRKRGMQWS